MSSLFALKLGRLIVWAAFILIQIGLLVQYHVVSKAKSAAVGGKPPCSFQLKSSGIALEQGKERKQALLSPSFVDCQHSITSPKPSNDSESIIFKDLVSSAGIRYDTLKYRAPAVYPNVNYSLAQELSRIFPVWNHSFPCFPTELDWYTVIRQKASTKQGFFYFKARKAGSSTVAGVALRIARTKAKQAGLQATSSNATHCHTRYGHPAAHRLRYHYRDRLNSFLWSIIREPTKRDISEFFHFGVSRGSKMEPNRQGFQAYHEWTPLMHEYYLQFMSTDKAYKMGKEGEDHVRSVAKIMTDYDFIGITERMHESLVALQLILDLNTSDILFLSAKTSGGWDDGLSNGQCYYIHPPVVSPQLSEYFESEDWMEKTKGGNLLYVTANRSLDLTIASFNQSIFQQKLRTYKWALKEAQTRCNGKVRFPCSAGGVLQQEHDCLLWDSGCGYDCLDSVAQELGL